MYRPDEPNINVQYAPQQQILSNSSVNTGRVSPAYPPTAAPYGRTGGPPPPLPPPYKDHAVVIMEQPQAFNRNFQPLEDLGSQSINLICPNCHNHINTQIVSHPNVTTWLACFVLFLCGCVFCACIPFCLPACKEVEHNCPICHITIGRHKP
ncbi:hypothetical protein SNEBB_008391 [Seison nebaliae]|nr:hypothetical protein SNEBB_008391 [Seison nebaliae]